MRAKGAQRQPPLHPRSKGSSSPAPLSRRHTPAADALAQDTPSLRGRAGLHCQPSPLPPPPPRRCLRREVLQQAQRRLVLTPPEPYPRNTDQPCPRRRPQSLGLKQGSPLHPHPSAAGLVRVGGQGPAPCLRACALGAASTCRAWGGGGGGAERGVRGQGRASHQQNSFRMQFWRIHLVSTHLVPLMTGQPPWSDCLSMVPLRCRDQNRSASPARGFTLIPVSQLL